jgi:hypothetical protein
VKYFIKSGAIIDALSSAQVEFPTLTQDKSGYNYQYLTLPAILNHIRPILAKNGISVVQGSEIVLVDGIPFVQVETRLLYKDESLENVLNFPLGDAPKGMSEIQYMGSIFSYLKRYSLLGMLGIAGAEKEIEDIQTENINQN